jgi:hypothetical protein
METQAERLRGDVAMARQEPRLEEAAAPYARRTSSSARSACDCSTANSSERSRSSADHPRRDDAGRRPWPFDTHPTWPEGPAGL